MESQHKKIRGYRELNEVEIARINEIKRLGSDIDAFIEAVEIANSPAADPRWVAIGKTHLQQGIMALVRAVAKPEFS